MELHTPMSAFSDLRGFAAALEAADELVRIPDPLSPHLEIPAVADRMMKTPGGGKALWFERPQGYDMPVLVNAFGSRRRMALALGVDDVDEVADRIRRWLSVAPPRSLGEALRLAARLPELRGLRPKRIRKGSAPCQEVVHRGQSVDLTRLPVLTCWPDDGGPFVTFPCVFTRDPKTGRQNVGMYRLQVFDRNTTGMHWHIHKDASRLYHAHREQGRPMPVAVAIGTDPVVTYCATAPLPPGVDEILLAGFIRKRPVEMVPCLTVDLEVPATAEIVLEGYVDPAETRIEGPFGDHTGYYSPAEPYPVFHVTAVTHRRDPVYFATVVGVPPMEDAWMGWATERVFAPLLSTQWPEVLDMHLPVEGVFHNLALFRIEKHFPMQARRLFQGLWGTGQMSFTKVLVALDTDVDVTDPRAATRAVLDRLRLPEGLVVTEGVLDALDHSGIRPLWGGKLGVDATRSLPGEPGHGEPPPSTAPAPGETEILERLQHRFPGLVSCRIPFSDTRVTLALLVLDKGRPGEGKELASAAIEHPGVDVAVAVEGSPTEPLARLAWRALASIDPVRDLVVRDAKVAVDATSKEPQEGYDRQWPAEVKHPPELVARAEEILRVRGLV